MNLLYEDSKNTVTTSFCINKTICLKINRLRIIIGKLAWRGFHKKLGLKNRDRKQTM